MWVCILILHFLFFRSSEFCYVVWEGGEKSKPKNPRNLNSVSAIYRVTKLQPELAHTAEVVSGLSLDKKTYFHLLTNLFPNTLLLLWCLYVEVDSSPSPLTRGPG